MSADVIRLAVVVARHAATAACPPGVDPHGFAEACLADSYEVAAGLAQVDAGICGRPGDATLLWPGHHLYREASLRQLAELAGPQYDELVLLPADVPDLPGLVVAKVFQALGRSEVVIAPERGGPGVAVLGLRLPWPGWLPAGLDLDVNPVAGLRRQAPRRQAVATVPGWHRLRTPRSVARLDPGLEGWEETRALLSGVVLGGG